MSIPCRDCVLVTGMKRSQLNVARALEGVCARMTVEEKVAAITQFDIMEVMDVEAGMRGEFILDVTKLRRLAKAGVGSFLNSPTAGGPLGKLCCPTAAQWRGAMKQLEDVYLEEGKVRTLPFRQFIFYYKSES